MDLIEVGEVAGAVWRLWLFKVMSGIPTSSVGRKMMNLCECDENAHLHIYIRWWKKVLLNGIKTSPFWVMVLQKVQHYECLNEWSVCLVWSGLRTWRGWFPILGDGDVLRGFPYPEPANHEERRKDKSKNQYTSGTSRQSTWLQINVTLLHCSALSPRAGL